jgi:hypothetical protein
MDAELLEALAAEVAQQIARVRADGRRELAEQVLLVQSAAADEVLVLRERLAEATHRLEMTQQEVQVLRAEVADPVIAFTLDAAGAMHLVQRNGPTRALPLPDTQAIARALVEAEGARALESLRGEVHADIARTFELYCNAPAWTATAVYAAGDIVQTDIGRTYRVRKGIRATVGREPGEAVDHWERLGSGGFRVLKSRPETLAAGDVFTEHDARFLHDGRATILFVPKGAKTSDIERAVKAPHALAQTVQAQHRELAAEVADLRNAVERNATAANDAGEIGVQALAQIEAAIARVEPLQRRLDELTAAIGGAP